MLEERESIANDIESMKQSSEVRFLSSSECYAFRYDKDPELYKLLANIVMSKLIEKVDDIDKQLRQIMPGLDDSAYSVIL